MDSKKFKTINDALENGAILQSYGSKYLVTVSPAPSIHKVKWSIVELNTGGKVFSNFFMSMEQMRQLCEEIEKGNASKKLAADKDSQYPSAYKYVTGENGCKHLNIGGGQKGLRVQIQENKDGKWDNKMSVISVQDFLQMNFLFKLTMGLELFVKGSYYGGLYDSFWKGESKRSEFFSKTYSSKEDDTSDEIVEEKSENKPESEYAVSPKPITPEEKPEVKGDYEVSKTPITPTSTGNIANSEMVDMKFKVTKILEEVGNRGKLTAINEKGKTFHLWIDEETKNLPEYESLIKPLANTVGSIITVRGLKKENNFLVKTIL